jgi:uncharacterized protein (TIGR02001 family)
MTQSDNSPAIQGGFDLDYKGVYVGVWGSNIRFEGSDANMEFDTYAGYTNEVFGVGYDLGYLQVAYPNDSQASNFGEVHLGLSYDLGVVEVSAKYSVGVKTNDFEQDDCVEGGISAPLLMDITLDATVGNYIHTGIFYNVGISKSFGKFDFSVAYTGMNYDDSANDDKGNVVATISSSF